uniref:Uncharacterized protein n=1 Tax=Anguilla anguilla TaxID=7936 RepID=A0A0E9U027_ANGAN
MLGKMSVIYVPLTVRHVLCTILIM